ncbi:hypothetical protein SEVIR_1G104500v4 [Setaria viridis]|uniref:BHLH domain-containing protein n=2 Tax=Setaria TaxID=4554 RepID=A0A368PIW6_SETIT|nr:hypothetical protein SETIT_1G105000v2 [Setaria italica]TKW38285.1 hypothetical protein SEVIR_1G104500v2 [Setaria viridis]
MTKGFPGAPSLHVLPQRVCRALRGVVPGGGRMDTPAVLDEAVWYLKSLKVEATSWASAVARTANQLTSSCCIDRRQLAPIDVEDGASARGGSSSHCMNLWPNSFCFCCHASIPWSIDIIMVLPCIDAWHG